MGIFVTFILYLAAMLVLAAALHYPLYSLLSDWFTIRPDRLMYRSAMVFAAIGLWPLMKGLRLANREAAGYSLPEGGFWRTLLRGWGWGLAILLVLSLGLLLLGMRVPHETVLAGKLLKVLLAGLVGGLLVGFIEETFFRGVMHHSLRRSLSFWPTAALTSSLYAALHFMRPPHMKADDPVDWSTGWQLLAGMFDRFADPLALIDSFIALVAVGLFLSLVRERNGNIALCIGLHAGWVLVIKLTRFLTQTDPASPLAFLAGSYDGMIGWLATGWLVLLMWLYRRRHAS